MIWPVLALYFCWIAPDHGWSFPGEDGLPVSVIGEKIDHLFWVIMGVVTVVFIGTQTALGYVLWTASQRKPGEKTSSSHGNSKLEIIWTVIPGAILLFLAFYQMNVWAEYRVKSQAPKEVKQNVIAEVTGRQFEWRIRYPARGKALQSRPQPDDFYDVNELHVPVGASVMIQLRTEDVQHSFFLPMLRVKQDAVPGWVIPVWFEATKPGVYPMMCAELCGLGHYRMAGNLVVHKKEEYEAFMDQLEKKRMSDGTTEKSLTKKSKK